MVFSKSLLLLKEHFGAYRHFFFFGRGKGGKFPCFQCGKWKICKLIEGKNQEKVQNPREMLFPSCFKQLCLYGRVWAQQKRNRPCKWARCGSWAAAVRVRVAQGTMSPGVAVGPGQGSCSLWPPDPSCSWFSLEGSLLLSLGCSGQAEDKVPPPSGAMVGPGGSEAVPISQYNPKARSLWIWPPKGIFHPPRVFAFKGSTLDFTKMPSLSVLGHRAHSRGTGTALGVGVRAFP